jgi:hypothetical protein
MPSSRLLTRGMDGREKVLAMNTNETYAIEKQAAIPVCYESAAAAWDSALNYSGTPSNYYGKIYENVGWVRGTKSTDGEWGAYLWVLQNKIVFQTSTSYWWAITNNLTVAITNVYVGSLGIYGPMESNVVDIGPEIPTNFPGEDLSDTGTYRVDITNIYYQLVIPAIWITPRDVVVAVGNTNAIRFTVTGTNLINGATWTLEPNGLSGGATMQSNCWYSRDVYPGNIATSYTIRATSLDNSNFYDEVNLRVLKIDIEQIETNVSWTATSVALNLTVDSYLGNGTANWGSTPSGISGNGTDITFNPSSHTPTTYIVRAQSSLLTNCFDTCTVTVLKVESIEASSPVADNSPNTFEGQKSWPFDVTKSPTADEHLVVFYKDAIDSSFNVQDFDVTLKANILPTEISADQFNEIWSKISGPSSGSLNKTDTFEIKYQNPKQGGVYRFDFDLGLSGCSNSEANVVLPLAGAEVDIIVQADIERANTFATTVVARYTWLQRQNPINGLRWFVQEGAGDYLGRPDNESMPTVWVYNQVNISSSFGMGAVGTWKGKPVRIAKISNFIAGYGVRKIGVCSVAAWISQIYGTWNDSAASKSWDAGWDVGGGASYNTTVIALVADVWDEADDKNQKLWPNSAAADNYVTPDSFSDPDHEFTSPGFLYMTNP